MFVGSARQSIPPGTSERRVAYLMLMTDREAPLFDL